MKLYDTLDEYFAQFTTLPKSEKKEDWEKVFKSMAVHTRKRTPKELLLARRPNEEEKIFQYRLANYRAITYGSINKAMDDVYRIVSGVSYTITAPEEVKEYLTSHTIDQYSNELHSEVINPKYFIEKICLKRGIEDPNGFLIWMPTGDGLIDSSIKVVPEPKLILSSQYRYSDESVFIYESEEKTPLEINSGEFVNEGELYYYLTKNEIWKNYQVGQKSDPRWVQELVYTHKLGIFPVIVLGGDMNAEGFYESYFAPYLAFGDEAIHQFSDWQAIMTTSSFPIREVFAKEVFIKRKKINKLSNEPNPQEENYSGGGANDDYELVPMAPTPYGEIVRQVPPQNLNSDVLPAEIAAVRYISPDIGIAKYSGESWEMLIKKAEQSLNIDVTLGIDQSGTAKKIDKESQYSMISKIGSNFYDNIYLNSIKIIDGYLNLVQFKSSSCSIAKPSTFYVKTESELTEEISTLKTSNAPSFFLAEATIELAKKRFNGNRLSEKIFEVVALYDPLYTDTDSEKSNKLAQNVITKEDYINSVRVFSILQQIARELSYDKFISTEHAKIYEMFIERVKEFYPADQTIQYDANGNPI